MKFTILDRVDKLFATALRHVGPGVFPVSRYLFPSDLETLVWILGIQAIQKDELLTGKLALAHETPLEKDCELESELEL
jgi:hypothetical protein